MRVKRKLLLLLLLGGLIAIVFLSHCGKPTNYQSKDEQFDSLAVKFKSAIPPFSLYDTAVLLNWEKNNTVDSCLVSKYNLIGELSDTQYPVKTFPQYHLSAVCRYRYKDFSCLYYKFFTTEAGSGNPILVLTTFSNQGKKLDSAVLFKLVVAGEPLYDNNSLLSCINDSVLTVTSITTRSGLLGSESDIIPRIITEEYTIYFISANGKINHTPKTERIIYSNLNPRIRNDFPQ